MLAQLETWLNANDVVWCEVRRGGDFWYCWMHQANTDGSAGLGVRGKDSSLPEAMRQAMEKLKREKA